MKTIIPNDLGEKHLTEQCQKISIFELVRNFKRQIKESMSNSMIESLGIEINVIKTKPNFGGERMWLQCPLCGNKKALIYLHPFNGQVGCRQCLNLEYRKRRYKGMLENSSVHDNIS
jgi:hypothetical protein